ncbi:hypothetical protein [Brevibacillus sp. NRS-1366]|uniref:hypothetical protein n=1 Tax=Brevibacillus sp. NRS-1366 TaxID=3233899 RepID=UPI003D1A9D39
MEVFNLRRSMLLLYSLILLFSVLPLARVADAKAKDEIRISVSVSPASMFFSTLTFHDKQFASQLLRAKHIPATPHPHWSRAYLTVNQRTFEYDHNGHLFAKNKPKQYLLSKQMKNRLEELVLAVEKVHYGQAVHWNQVKKSFGRMDYATVIDLETGEHFDIQRRAGSRHADVQPLTKNDTMIMKNIYQGKWSWKRRAILVEVDGIYYAASMHGMPHGAGAIKGNEFPGHFCIHFLGSSTHRRKEPDPSHSLMILKASGALAGTMMSALPEQLVGYFLTALHEHDDHAMRMATDGFPLPTRLGFVVSVKKTKAIIPSDEVGPFLVEIPVQVDYFTENGADQAERWNFILRRSSPLERWRIVSIEMKK